MRNCADASMSAARHVSIHRYVSIAMQKLEMFARDLGRLWNIRGLFPPAPCPVGTYHVGRPGMVREMTVYRVSRRERATYILHLILWNFAPMVPVRALHVAYATRS